MFSGSIILTNQSIENILTCFRTFPTPCIFNLNNHRPIKPNAANGTEM